MGIRDRLAQERVREAGREVNNRMGAAERFWLIVFGAAIIWLATTSAMKSGQYPTGDLRNEPLFWMVALGFGFVLGGLAVLSGLRGGMRGGRRR